MAIACLISCTKDKPEQGIIVNNKALQRFLLALYDANKDGILSEEEALNVTQISVTFSQEPIDGLEHFPNLELIDVTGGEFTSIDVSKNTKLKQVFCNQTKLATLDLTNNLELEMLNCGMGEIKSINLGNKPKLTWIYCGQSKLTSLDVSGCHNLTVLGCYDNLLTELDVRNSPHLEWLSCSSNQFETIDVSKNIKLTNFNCYNNRFLTSLDVSKNTELKEFLCDGNILITTLDVSNNAKLESLLCADLNITTLDISNNPELWQLRCPHNANLMTLYLKTGQTIKRLTKDTHTTIVYLP